MWKDELQDGDTLIPALDKSMHCLQGPDRQTPECPQVMRITRGNWDEPKAEGDTSRRAQKDTRFDMCVWVRRKDGVAPGSLVPLVLIEVSGQSVRTAAQHNAMLDKMQCCMNPQAVQAVPGEGRDGGAYASESRRSLFFVSDEDLKQGGFRRALVRQILAACMHTGLWDAVPGDTELRARWRGMSSVLGDFGQNAAYVTYTKPDPNLWGHLARLLP